MKKRRIVTAIFLLIFLVCAVQVSWKLYESNLRSREYEDAAQVAGLLPETPDEPAAPPPAPPEEKEPLPEEVLALAAIDLEALRAVNPDVVGWIEIPDTPVSYPVLQSEDNQYYLTHTWSGDTNSGGSIFLEQTSRADLTGYHTIVYGHRMRDESMFGSLKYYRDGGYWQEHPSVYLAWDSGVYRYDIFAAHEASVTGLVYRLDLKESSLEDEFLETCLDGSAIDTGIVPTPEDQILTLSTCTGTGYATRWVVHAVLSEVMVP